MVARAQRIEKFAFIGTFIWLASWIIWLVSINEFLYRFGINDAVFWIR